MKTNYIILLVALLITSILLNLITFTQLNYYNHQIVVDLPEEYPLINKDDLLTGELNVTKNTLFITFIQAKWPAPADYTIEFINPKGLTRITSEETMYVVPFELIEETIEKNNL